jgi:hypothetical protein
MKINTGFFSIVLILLLVAAAGAATTVTVTSSQDAVTQVYVSGVELDPSVFYPNEPGTITVHVTNGSNLTVTLGDSDLIDPNVNVLNKNSFQMKTNVGPGATVDYIFLVTMDPPDGTYIPIFTVSPTVGNSIHASFKVVVDSTDVRSSISKKPDSFSISKKDTVNVSVINPRAGDVTDVLIVAEGTGADVTPLESFVGTLKAGSSIEVPFQIIPSRQSNLTFHVSFKNGNNKHVSDVVLPLSIGTDKLAAQPIVNNLAIVSQGPSYYLTGDVSNAGITDAKSMVLTVADPAKPVEPYAEYAIGSLASDDFSSFELTFVAGDLASVPLQIQWKDSDGNTFSTVKNLDLRYISASGTSGSRTGSSGSSSSAGSATGSSTARTGGNPPGGGGMFGIRGGGLSSFYPVIAGGIIVTLGIVLWIKRKWIAGKLKKR